MNSCFRTCSYKESNYWIGLKYSPRTYTREGYWFWTTAYYADNVNWYPGHPNTRLPDRHCGVTCAWGVQLCTRHCNEKLSYICKQGMYSVTVGSKNRAAVSTIKPIYRQKHSKVSIEMNTQLNSILSQFSCDKINTCF